eukprot:516941_1
MSNEDVVNQLMQFGYSKDEIMNAIDNTNNENDINEITNYLQNQQKNSENYNESIEELQDIIETSLNKLHKKNFNIDTYLNKLTNKYMKTEQNEILSDEKKQNDITNKPINISLLTNIKESKMCPKGHLLDIDVNKNKCTQCASMDTSYMCFSCANYDKYYEPNMYEDATKYYCCDQCATINSENVKMQLSENKRKENEIIEYYKNNPHLAKDLLCQLSHQLSLQFLLKEIIVSDENERRGYCMYKFNIDNFKELNKTLGQMVADEKLKQIGKILRKYTEKKNMFWKKKNIFIERIWCFRQKSDEFCIIVKGKPKQVRTQFGFYKLLKKDINGIDINFSVGALINGSQLNDCTVNNWLMLSNKALCSAKKIKGKNSLRICDGMAHNGKGKVVERFEDVKC